MTSKAMGPLLVSLAGTESLSVLMSPLHSLSLWLLARGTNLWILGLKQMSYMGQATLGATKNKHTLKYLTPGSTYFDFGGLKKYPSDIILTLLLHFRTYYSKLILSFGTMVTKPTKNNHQKD